jgi:hypothetical protein
MGGYSSIFATISMKQERGQGMTAQQQIGRAALLWGTVFGFVLFGIGFVVDLILPRLLLTNHLSITTYSYISLAIGSVIALSGYFVAGLLAGRQARSVVAGTFAGLITAAIQHVVGIIASSVILTIVEHVSQRVLTFLFVSDLIYLVIYIGLGAGAGALGGLAGRASAGGAQVVVGYPPPGYYPGGMPAYPPPAGPYPQGPYAPNVQPPYPYPYQQPPQGGTMAPPQAPSPEAGGNER